MIVPVYMILLNTEKCLVYIGQDPKVSYYAQKYVLAYLPGLMLSGLNDA